MAEVKLVGLIKFGIYSALVMSFFSTISLTSRWNLYCCSAIAPRRRRKDASSIKARELYDKD
jgi:hypothetical protein